MLPEEGSTISFTAGEDRITGILTKYGYDGYSGQETSFYLEDNPYMRYPIGLISGGYTLVSPPPDEAEGDEEEGDF